MNAEFQRIAIRDKKAFLSDQCKEMEENNRMGKTRDLFKKIRDMGTVWGAFILIFTVRDIAEKYDYEVIRFFMLSAHYRSPINFCDELMDAAKNGLDRIYNCIDNIEFLLGSAQSASLGADVKNAMDGYKEKFINAMEDDLNTADAISAIFEAVRFANSLKNGRAHV